MASVRAMRTVGTFGNISRQAASSEVCDRRPRRDQHFAAHVSAFFFARELILEMHACRARFDHRFDQFENIERSAEAGFRIGDDRAEPIDLVLAFGV